LYILLLFITLSLFETLGLGYMLLGPLGHRIVKNRQNKYFLIYFSWMFFIGKTQESPTGIF